MICLKCQKPLESTSHYGLHLTCFFSWFQIKDAEQFVDLDPKSSDSAKINHEIEKKKDTFFHGKFQKYSASLANVQYILKVQEDQCPELPAIEYISNRIATCLGIQVPTFYLVRFESNLTFVTRNFMQDHVGTLNHIYKYLPAGEASHNCEEIIKVILQETGRLADVVDFIYMCLFDSLIGNNDRHGRNIGIIVTAKGKKLAPMYDNPSYIGIADQALLGAQFNPSGSVWTTKSKNPKPTDYMEEFIRLGHEAIVKNFCKKVTTKSAKIFKSLDLMEISAKRKTALMNLLERRLKDFEDAVK